MRLALDPRTLQRLTAPLDGLDAARALRYPGDAGTRQPVHTCYVPAPHVDAGLVRAWGSTARSMLNAHAPSAKEFAAILDMDDSLAEDVYVRVLAKLDREPIEDLRIDFEDGYGAPGDDIEDADTARTASVVSGWSRDGGGPPFVGIRMKSFDTARLRARGLRTLDLFLTAMLDGTDGVLPAGFALTFPKVTAAGQVAVLADILDALEPAVGLDHGALRFEIQIETTQAVIDADGRLAPPGFIAAGRGRVSGLHFGTYDYTAGCGISAAHQHLAHASCDFARHVMQVSAAGTGVRLSDGSTNVLPVGDHEAVLHGWRTHYRLAQRSLAHGFYQGWDLHAAQLPTRFAAAYAFFRAGAQADGARLRAYVERAGGAILDEPATAQALSIGFLRALDCGALDQSEVAELTGLDAAGLRALAAREEPSVTP